MLLIAFAATFFAGLTFGQKREHCLMMAQNHAQAEAYFRSIASTSPTGFAARIALRGELRRKWERAANFPWWPVAPDPPDPNRGRRMRRFGMPLAFILR